MVSNMKQVGIIHITQNSVNPITECFQKKGSEIKIFNYLDGFILDKIKMEGGITSSSIKRMLHMVGTAFEDGADAVLISCTMFSPYVDYFSDIFKKPVISADRAMFDEVTQKPAKTAILCTFAGTITPTMSLYSDSAKKNNITPNGVIFVVEGALDAINNGDTGAFVNLIQKKALELDGEYEQIVFAQISMAPALENLNLKTARVFTSPLSALEAVRHAL